MSVEHGIIRAQFPIMSVPLEPEDSHANVAQPNATISKDTPAVVLTRNNFYFGNLEDFTDKFSDVRNKFFISHIDGEPQVAELVSTMTRWHRQKNLSGKKIETGVLVFLPSSEIPVPIVTQVMYWIQKSELYENVILASELL